MSPRPEAAAEAADPEVIVQHPKCLAGPHLAEARDVPGVRSLPLPFSTPTRAFPIPFPGGATLPGWANRASYAFTRATTPPYGGMINDFRRRLGPGPIGRLADPLRDPHGARVPVLRPHSRHVVPVPADSARSRPTASPSDDVLVVDAVPHDWLFDRVAAVVHHGGARR